MTTQTAHLHSWGKITEFVQKWHNSCVSSKEYRQVSNTRCTLAGNKIVNHSDVVDFIFILDLTPGFIGLGKDNCTTRRETIKFGDLVHLVLY